MRIGDDVGCAKSPSRYRIEERLGEGAYGVVFKARSNQSSAMVALKSISEDDDNLYLYRELSLMLHFKKCPHIPQIFGVLPDPSVGSKVVLMMELLDTDLHQWLNNRRQKIELSHVRLLLYQMLGALHWLHGCGVIHRDIKLPNILLYKEWFLKVCDLGEADINGEDKKYDRVGAFAPRAPELLCSTCPYSTATDVWSVGICFQHLLASLYNKPVLIDEDSWVTSHDSIIDDLIKVTGIPDDSLYENLILSADAKKDTEEAKLLNDDDWEDILTFSELLRSLKYQDTRALDWSAEWGVSMNPDAHDLLRRMLCFDPTKRITVSDALQHEFFTGASRNSVSKLTFIDEVTAMGVAVDLNRQDTPFVFDGTNAAERLQTLVTRLQKESEEEALHGMCRVDDYYMHRKRIIGNMMISPLVVPEEVILARSTLCAPHKRNNLLVSSGQSKIMRVMPRCMTIGGLHALDDMHNVENDEGLTRSNSIVTFCPSSKRH